MSEREIAAGDLNLALDELRSEGFRLDVIYPADDPHTAILTRGSERVRLTTQPGAPRPSDELPPFRPEFVLTRAGKVVPRDMAGQYDSGVHPAGELLPGDIIFFKNTYEEGLSHNGIYLGNLQFIHAIDEDRGVGISNLTEPYYTTRWYGTTRIP